MPFQKVGPNRYRGPSGKTFDYDQVKLYYSNGGKFPGQKSDQPDNRNPLRKHKNQHTPHR